ncbi:hypothetical protein FACS1894151_10910 [Spirochaetia bacterium]|nr:hypothetical protein FACS1894151_10910 [Spirochaetia bacterium]
MSALKLFCLEKDGKYLAWDMAHLVDRPSEAARVSKTMAQRKYADYTMRTFSEAYNEWFKRISGK